MSKKYIYTEGEKLGPQHDIIFIKEIPPLNHNNRRRAEFYCEKCQQFYQSDIAEVKRGKKDAHVIK